MSSSEYKVDIALVGGGLANSLIALRLKALRPDLRVVMLEREARVGGEHTWCHFANDVPPDVDAWLEPLIAHRWDGYEVRFPAHRRDLATPYRAITTSSLARAVSAALGPDLWLDAPVATFTPDTVTLADQRVIRASAVIDGRGPSPTKTLALGWQKFLGQEIITTVPHGLTRPTVMDATVDQLDGYRFLYVLPLGPDRLLIEDTRYSDGDALDREAMRLHITAYAASRGWEIAGVVREEDGILPIALAGDIDAFWAEGEPGVARVGLAAALFQPTTGYASPDAAILADRIARLPELTSATVRAAAEAHSKAAWKARGFYRLLNRMLFRACAPQLRYRVLERFYRLGAPLIQRFYSSNATLADKARILSGKPPVPVTAALKVLTERSVFTKVS
jgi:lycopene beta-cyclase